MRTLLVLVCLAAPLTASAQAHEIFSQKPPTWREEDLDRKFLKSRIHKALVKGTDDPACAQVLGGLLTTLADAGMSFHRRDQDIYLDPALVQLLNAQLNNPRFPGTSYFLSMVRRVLIEKQLPKEWLQTAIQLSSTQRTIDLSKLRYLSEGLRPVDSFHFTLPLLRHRWDVEVKRAMSAAKADAEADFRSGYLDREVAWHDLELVDIKLEKPSKGALQEGPPAQIATLKYTEVKESNDPLAMLHGKKKGPTVTVQARLEPTQYIDVSKLSRGARMLVRGRLFDVKKNASWIDLREAYLFLDFDWSRGALADPQAVARCPLAFNDLTGTAPRQPGGWGQR